MGRGRKPDIRYRNIYEIDPETLKERGIRGVIFDIDNTMEPYAAPLPGEKLTGWLNGLAERGFRIGILSNAKKERIEKFTSGFPETLKSEILYVYGAAKPSKKGYIALASRCGLEPEQLAMVGDQLFTDIWGGNRAGCLTVLVEPIDPAAEPPFVRFKRKLEKLLYERKNV